MARRGENVYKRKDGRWEGRILKEDGKYCYFYGKTYKEVKEKMRTATMEKKAKTVKLVLPKNNAVKLFENWLEGDMVDRVKPSTYENYYCCMQKYVIPFFSINENQQITSITALEFVKHIQDNSDISESYKKKIISIFKTALKDILRDKLECATILSVIKIPRAESKEVQIFTMKEQKLIEKAVFLSKEKGALGILICFYTGIRLGELCALKWSDIDMEAGNLMISRTVSRIMNFHQSEQKTMLFVGTPKSRKSTRKIPLPAFLLQTMQECMPYSSKDNYILSGKQIPMDPRSYQKLFKKILLSAQVKERKFHAIRHTFATRALELGVDIKTISDILGHSNVTITLNTYAHSLMEQKKIAIQKFNEMHMSYMNFPVFAVDSAVTVV